MTGTEQKEKPANYDLENTLDACQKYIQGGKDMSPKDKIAQYFMAAPALPEDQKKAAYALVAAECAYLAEDAMKQGHEAPAKVYAAILAYCMKESGIDMKEIMPEGQKDIGKYISSLFDAYKKEDGGKSE